MLRDAKLDHISYLVKDREAAIHGFQQLIGASFERFEYTNTAIIRGERCTYTLHMALAAIAPNLDLELIELKAGRNPVHEEFLRDRGEGLQHIAYQVPNLEDTVKAFEAAGYPAMLRKADGPGAAVYVDTRSVCGSFLELIRWGFTLRNPGPAVIAGKSK